MRDNAASNSMWGYWLGLISGSLTSQAIASYAMGYTSTYLNSFLFAVAGFVAFMLLTGIAEILPLCLGRKDWRISIRKHGFSHLMLYNVGLVTGIIPIAVCVWVLFTFGSYSINALFAAMVIYGVGIPATSAVALLLLAAKAKSDNALIMPNHEEDSDAA